MKLTALTAISPVDGRYRSKAERLAEYFSEYALIRYRVQVEVEYFIALSGMGLPRFHTLTGGQQEALRDIYRRFTQDDAMAVKNHEAVTNHDVKAVEYFLKDRLKSMGMTDELEYVHFGLTSQDINNTATPMLLADALDQVYYPALENLIATLKAMADEWSDIPMLAHTHGQPASPTRLGKEIRVFVYRLEEQSAALRSVKITGKFGGATGNMNAHRVAFPSIDWPAFANSFLTDILGIAREQVTTQISNYDHLAALFDALRRINTIILDLDRDIWTYISMEYFRQKIKAGEVGSSAMPHKVNPIDFENSEGNIGMANALFAHLAQKLPVSRLQRDLTDSTVLRNVGVPLAHTLIAFASTAKGLGKLIVNREAIARDLDNHQAVVAEAIQTVLRREGYPHPYETLKQLTRTNQTITADSIADFINSLNVSDAVKEELRTITPASYLGY